MKTRSLFFFVPILTYFVDASMAVRWQSERLFLSRNSCHSTLSFRLGIALVSPGLLRSKIVCSWSSLLATVCPAVSKALLVDRGGVMLLLRFTPVRPPPFIYKGRL